jgi:hypothetical protein
MSGAPPLPASTPSRAAGLLGLVRKLTDYGTFLAGTLRQRGLGDHPIVHGLQFGTTNITLILARIARGLLRAAALEALLNRNAARLDAPPPSSTAQSRQPAAARSAASGPSAPRRPASRDRTEDDDALLAQMPTPEQIAAEIRRRPIGEVIADICRDLGIIPAHPLWEELAQAILCERGRYAALIIDILKRPRRMPPAQDWPEVTPPYLWAAWPHTPTPASTGPP